MRFLAVAALLVATQTQAVEFQNKDVFCADLDTVVGTLQSKKYREAASFIGTNARGSVVVFVNETTQSWTVIEHSNKKACILGAGRGYKTFVIPKDA